MVSPRRSVNRHSNSIVVAEGLLFVILLALLLGSPDRFVYDEVNTVPTISAFHRYGLTSQYLNSLGHASGPLYGAIYGILSPATLGRVYRIRFINYALLCSLGGLLVWLLRRQNFCAATPLAWSIIGIPTLWVCSGIALDEMLGLVLLTCGLIFIDEDAFNPNVPTMKRAVRFCLAGVAIGLASLVRQPFILASFAIAIAPLLHHRVRFLAFMTPLLAVTILAPAVLTWRGLTPPLVGKHAGLSIAHGMESLGYGALFMFLLAPAFFRFNRWRISVSVLLSFAINAGFGLLVLIPVATIASRVLAGNASAIRVYGLLCGDLVLAAGIFFLLSLSTRIVESRHDVQKTTNYVGSVALLVWPVIMSVQYSSRYSLMAIPFMILAARDYYSVNVSALLRTVVGGILGAAVLSTYYWR